MAKKERRTSLERSERPGTAQEFSARLRHALEELDRSLAWDET